jgi:hypothetical protein
MNDDGSNLLVPFIGGGAFLVGTEIIDRLSKLIDDAIGELPESERPDAEAERESIYHELLRRTSDLGYVPASISLFKKAAKCDRCGSDPCQCIYTDRPSGY